MRYDPVKIEKKWREKWLKSNIYEPDLTRGKQPFYNLMMFPYPSAEGLHIGSVRTFSGVDIFGRYMRMKGHNVIEPIGLDGFGIHSENYALKIDEHPMKLAKVTEKNFYRQLSIIGNSFSWKERLETYDPEYYKWTQWIFIQLYKHGLAYRKAAKVNWCPSCQTVLADEQVIKKSQVKNPAFAKASTDAKALADKSAGRQKSKADDGVEHLEEVQVCERCETPVIKKDLEQWFFLITNYAERLLQNLETIDWDEKIKIAQRNWIGKSEGAEIDFKVKDWPVKIKVFTTRPDTLFGATYLVMAPEHALIQSLKHAIKNWGDVEKYIGSAAQKTEVERTAETKEKTGVELKSLKAINPANGEEIPIWISDYVLATYGTGAIMAVPAHDQRDLEFAREFHLEVRPVIAKAEARSEIKPNLDASVAVTHKHAHVLTSAEMMKWIEQNGADEVEGGVLIDSGKFSGMDSASAKKAITEHVGGKMVVRYRLRDWLISRQRYWGPPIPMIFCDSCGWSPVPEKDLPVVLPFIKEFRPTGTGKSPLASVKSFYETKCPRCRGKARRETDVSDTFLDSAWYFLRYPSVRDKKNPWTPAVTKKWLPVDMYIGGAEHSVLHLLYSRFLTMVFHDWGLLDFEEPFTRFRAHGLVTMSGAKMSKSKGNVINPDDYIKAYGSDAMRMYLAFMSPLSEGGDFRDDGISGTVRFLGRVWSFYGKSKIPPSLKLRRAGKSQKSKIQIKSKNRLVHRTIKKVGEDIESLRYNTAISALMILLNDFEKDPANVSREDRLAFLKLLAPFAPHMAEELWQQMKGKGSIHVSSWPKYNQRLLIEETVMIIVQINGNLRAHLTLPRGASQEDVEAAARKSAAAKYLLGSHKRRVIFIPDRLINFVV